MLLQEEPGHEILRGFDIGAGGAWPKFVGRCPIICRSLFQQWVQKSMGLLFDCGLQRINSQGVTSLSLSTNSSWVATNV